MGSENLAIIIGRLGKDPQIRYTNSGGCVGSFSVATDDSYKNKKGDKIEETNWHQIVCFGARAEAVAEHIHKGSEVYVNGKIKTRSWDDKDGNKRYVTEIHASNIQFLGSKSGSGKAKTKSSPAPFKKSEPSPFDRGGSFDDSDVPF